MAGLAGLTVPGNVVGCTPYDEYTNTWDQNYIHAE